VSLNLDFAKKIKEIDDEVENPFTWQLLQIHTKVLIKALKLLGVIFCNSWTLMPFGHWKLLELKT
jgi:hypothetical protein